MKGRVLLLDKIEDREVAALMVDGHIEELAIDDDEALHAGAICRGVADRPMKGQGGIFVKLPDGRKGFLRQISGVAPGQRLLVQITGPAPEEGKALPVSTRLLFKSRYAIVTPGAPGLNISRRIRDEEIREELEALAKEGMAGAAPDLGLIIRSSCADAPLEEISEDIAQTRALAEAVLADTTGEPELLVEAPSAHDLAWREWLDPFPEEVVEEPGCFGDYGIYDAIDELMEPKVTLEGGGYMFIEPTRALVAVDVNTGNDTSPAAAVKANVAAARELPRQLRLRGLGGQIVIDFAPMPKKERHILDQVLKAAFKSEGETNLAGWTGLALYELTRRREKPVLKGL